ncbi:MAG: XdhC family protein [Planctomycetaceae bacterium]
MRHIIAELIDAMRAKRPVAYTALVETRGSTPQKAGAVMLVYADGSQVGTLGGGCVEAEVKRKALQILDEGIPELLTFQLDSDYGWDDGLICGGRMKMLIDPLRSGADGAYYTLMNELTAQGRGWTEAVIIDSEKAAGGNNADRFLLDADGKIMAHRGSGVAPESLQTHLKPLTDRPRPYVVEGISYLPLLDRCRLLIVGAGHVGQQVGAMAADVDFDVWVLDDREQFCNQDRFPKAKRLIVGEIDLALSGLEIDSQTMCIIVTRGHQHDEEALYHLADTPARYVGMIGSKRKIKMIFEDLLKEGIRAEALARVHAPLGFDIGSQTVPEIAISIVAELIAVRNLGSVPEITRHANPLPEVLAQIESAKPAS